MMLPPSTYHHVTDAIGLGVTLISKCRSLTLNKALLRPPCSVQAQYLLSKFVNKGNVRHKNLLQEEDIAVIRLIISFLKGAGINDKLISWCHVLHPIFKNLLMVHQVF